MSMDLSLIVIILLLIVNVATGSLFILLKKAGDEVIEAFNRERAARQAVLDHLKKENDALRKALLKTINQ